MKRYKRLRAVPTNPPGPSLRDWAQLIGALVFVVAGCAMFRSDASAAISIIAFFGVCAGVFALNIRRRLGYRRPAPLAVEVVGGVAIHPSSMHVIGLGAILAGLGTVLAVFGTPMGFLFQALGGFIGVVGIVLALGVVAGQWPAGYIQFDPEGLTIAGRRWSCQVPWSDIEGVVAGELNNNPVLLISLAQQAALVISPPERAPDVTRHLASNRRWMGAPIAIMSSRYGIDLMVLHRAVLRYASNPTARAELGERHIG